MRAWSHGPVPCGLSTWAWALRPAPLGLWPWALTFGPGLLCLCNRACALGPGPLGMCPRACAIGPVPSHAYLPFLCFPAVVMQGQYPTRRQNLSTRTHRCGSHPCGVRCRGCDSLRLCCHAARATPCTTAKSRSTVAGFLLECSQEPCGRTPLDCP